MESNPDPQSPSVEPDAPRAEQTLGSPAPPEPEVSPGAFAPQPVDTVPPPPAGSWDPPPGGDASGPGHNFRWSSGWGKRLAATGAALAVLVAVGFAGHAIGSSPSNQQANQPIPKPAASSGVTAKAGTLNVAAVTAKVEPGVVDITAVDGYQNSTAAGTGIVLTSNGEVLTNNHVIDGATQITAQVDGTGTKYTAKVVGYEAKADVALLQLQGASGLQTVTVGNSSTVSVGLPVVAIGNALDLPGKPTVTSGTITAVDRSITATDQGGAGSENLTGLLQTDAPLSPGNSGGPLANSTGQVIGMNTAAASSDTGRSASTVGFAIPINQALNLASQIQQGQSNAAIQLGLPAFLGVDVEDAASAGNGPGGFGGFGGFTPAVNSGALITGVLPRTPAQAAGLVAGDVVTAVSGSTISSAAGLRAALAADRPGQGISMTWVDASGSSHTANVTLGTGPAG